ncbi:MAG: nucleotide exchange factor GrpE [Prolixibacteraceae bacterium]|nr:nucleotide exchange factor GrpE [Prolixibacteraceae bacterium]
MGKKEDIDKKAKKSDGVSSPEEKEKKDTLEHNEEEEKTHAKKNIKDISDKKIEELQAIIEQRNDQLLRLHAEFDNYRKRTLKEKMELTKSASEGLLVNILPVLDDFERALKSMEEATEIDPVKDGINLIYKRFNEFVKSNGVKEIEAIEKEFDTDLHEAITKIPSPSEELKGKVVDVIQKGYLLNDKVIRFAKVVIGE